ncbi:MAG: VTT domain-containing protein [Candidatus Diapherotrites archaeon]|nr:VTT domain-containing protein [Candidatus Diapherotrites archaeon]
MILENFQLKLAELLNALLIHFGFLGLFVAAIIANATVFLPLPLDAFIFFAAGLFVPFGILSPLIIALVVGAGSAIGELSSYFAGYFGKQTIEKVRALHIAPPDEIIKMLHAKGCIFIFLGAFTPFPFDVIGIVAGILKYNIKKFVVACFAGKFLRYLIISYAGYLGIEAIKAFLL